MKDGHWRALAGTPNVYGIIFSLWQHPTDWGTKSVHSVTVFGDDDHRFCLFVTLATNGIAPTWALPPGGSEEDPDSDGSPVEE